MKQQLLPVVLVSLLLSAASCGRAGRGFLPGEKSRTLDRDGDPFSLMAIVHSLPHATAPPDPAENQPGPPLQTIRWDGHKEGGPFRYSSARCIDPAPINDISTNLTTFNGRIPESASPASIRLQPLEFRVEHGGPSGRLEGTIRMVACGITQGRFSRVIEKTEGPDTHRDRITFKWTADYKKTSGTPSAPKASEAAWTGTFDISEGTGRYRGISGSGFISGTFLCLQGVCDEPDFTDGQVVMVGTYKAPAIPSVSPF